MHDLRIVPAQLRSDSNQSSWWDGFVGHLSSYSLASASRVTALPVFTWAQNPDTPGGISFNIPIYPGLTPPAAVRRALKLIAPKALNNIESFLASPRHLSGLQGAGMIEGKERMREFNP